MKSTDFLLVILNELLPMGHSNRPSCLSGDHHRHRHHPRQRSTAHTKHLESIILCVCVCVSVPPSSKTPTERERGRRDNGDESARGIVKPVGRSVGEEGEATQQSKAIIQIPKRHLSSAVPPPAACCWCLFCCKCACVWRWRSLSVVFDSVCFQSHSNFPTERTCDGGTKTTAGFFPPHLLFYSLLLVCMYIELVHYRYCLLFFINPALIYTVCGVINSVD